MAKADETDYRGLSDELEDIVAALQQDDIDVDVAMQKYARGLELVAELEKYLRTAENRIEKLQGPKGT